jgi:CheY-like chemotaxis protein
VQALCGLPRVALYQTSNLRIIDSGEALCGLPYTIALSIDFVTAVFGIQLTTAHLTIAGEWRRLGSGACELSASGVFIMPGLILVVEDNADARFMLKFILEAQGFVVTCAEDGQVALEMIKTHRPDLIITDIQMPNLDGIELIKALRSQNETRDTPVLIMSAQQNEVLADALKAGGNAAAFKPVQIESLIKLIQQLLI